MADWHGGMSKKSGGARNEDFDEEEVWANYVKEKEDLSPTARKLVPSSSSSNSCSSSAWRLPSARPRMIPRVNNSAAILSHETKVAHQQSSAPVNIPDWSKIYGQHANNYMESSSSSSASAWVEINGGEDDDDDDMVPPHEWLARKLARSQISSFSVCEGIGRTLKGRDLSKVRNAVLTKTGFLE